MQQYEVTGMACAACSAKVEKTVSSLKGVTSCSVNLLSASMVVEGTATEEQIVKAVKKAGFSAELRNGMPAARDKSGSNELKPVIRRLVISASLLLVLMYFSMGFMAGLPQPVSDRTGAFIQAVLSLAVMVINRRFFISGAKAAIHLAPNMDTLISLGSGASYIYSICLLVSHIINSKDCTGYYFESAAMILTLISIGKMLEARSKGKAADAVASLVKLMPQTAHIIKDNTEEIISASELKKDDIFSVYPGECFPADGVITEGTTSADESSLTGESIPVEKQNGDNVSAGTVNTTGFVKCRATDTGEETALSKIIRLVEETGATKAPIAKAADKAASVFVPVVITIAVITFIVRMIISKDFAFSLEGAISVLVISCPCSLGLATPVAITVGSGVGARHGILFRNAAAIEETGRATVIVLDKTGTVTEGKPSVTDIIPADGVEEKELLDTAYAAEFRSSHPLSQAVLLYCKDYEGEPVIDKFTVIPGNGVEVESGNDVLRAGKLSFINKYCKIPDSVAENCSLLSSEGKTFMFFAKNDKYCGLIAAADKIKQDSATAVAKMKEAGLRVTMLTGDNRITAESIAKKAGIDEVVSDVLPDEKQKVIKELRQNGKIIMVGDGINDAPALTEADVGMAIGTGTDIAIESADVVLMGSGLENAADAVILGRKVLKTIKENLFWAFFYNSLGIPVAAGVLIPVLGISLSPVIAAAAMSLSSFCVVTNALRINGIKFRK